MPRIRKYASDAEKAKAYRLRKKLKENEHPAELDALAKAIHKIYKKLAENDGGQGSHLVGKTPFETLLRVVMYQVLYENHVPDGEAYEFPGWDKLIVPMDVSYEHGLSYEVHGVKSPTGVCLFLPSEDDFFRGDVEDQEEDCAA